MCLSLIVLGVYCVSFRCVGYHLDELVVGHSASVTAYLSSSALLDTVHA
jgi:hypothetical protein